MSYADDVKEYIDGVLSGRIVTGRLERLAVHRHVDDLVKAGDRGFYFDERIASKAIAVSRLCNQFEGEWAGKPLELRGEQKFIVWNLFGWRQKSDGLRRFRQAQIEVGRKAGKALALDTLLPTPTGWTTMGEVQVGDTLFDESGQQCRVTNTTDIMYGRPCYRVTFSDGTSMIADEQHEWLTQTRRSTLPRKGRRQFAESQDGVQFVATHARTRFRSVKTTKEIADTLHATARGECNHRVDTCGPLQTAEAMLPIDPYVLGCWLGDGTSRNANMTCAFRDHQIIDNIRARGITARQIDQGCTETTGLYLLGRGGGRGGLPRACFQRTLRLCGLLNNKHIPQAYMRASESKRWDLIRGLMDTDGCASNRNRTCEFTSTSLPLATGFMELARSVGLKPALGTGRSTLYGRDCGPKYRVTFPAPDGCVVFNLDRKQSLLDSFKSKGSNGSRSIVSVEKIDSVPVKCIEVDSPSHLYLASEAMIPTHNSCFASYLCILLSILDEPVEKGAQGYVAATKQDQAKIVWKCARRMIEQSPAFAKRAKITPSKLEIEFPDFDSIFRPIASDSKTVDGFNPHFIVKDEEHAYREQHRDLVDTLASGFGARSQPITITITTYGDDQSTIWQENHDYAVRCVESVITDKIVDDTWFAMICALDYPQEQPCFRCQGDDCSWCGGGGVIAPDDPYNEKIWRKANPGIGSGAGCTPKIERMRESALMAKQRKDKESEFFQKNLNIVVASRQRVIMPEVWESCAGELSDWDTADGINGAFDLGATDDFSAVMECASFTQTDDDGVEFTRYEFDGKSFTAEDRKEHMKLGFIERWIQEGMLSASPGNAVDLNAVEDYIVERAGLHTVGTWAFDKFGARQMGQSLLNTHGIPVFEFTQAACHYNEPVKMFLSLLNQTRMVGGKPVRLITHNGDPVLAWQATNLIIRRNAKGERMPDKSDGVGKIDAMVALLMAFSERMYHEEMFPEAVYNPGDMFA